MKGLVDDSIQKIHTWIDYLAADFFVADTFLPMAENSHLAVELTYLTSRLERGYLIEEVEDEKVVLEDM